MPGARNGLESSQRFLYSSLFAVYSKADQSQGFMHAKQASITKQHSQPFELVITYTELMPDWISMTMMLTSHHCNKNT